MYRNPKEKLVNTVKMHHTALNRVSEWERHKDTKGKGLTCFKWFLRMVPSGSGSGGISSPTAPVDVNLFESKSTSQISSGSLVLLNLVYKLNLSKTLRVILT